MLRAQKQILLRQSGWISQHERVRLGSISSCYHYDLHQSRLQHNEASRYASKGPHHSPSPLVQELNTIRDVILELNKSNRGVIKRGVLKEHEDSLKDLLLFLYDPHVRLNVTSANVTKYMTKSKEAGIVFPKVEYDSISTLLRELDSRTLTGNAAMNRIGSFLQQIEEEEKKIGGGGIAAEKSCISIEEVLMRCLDRNLKAGINWNTVKEVYGTKGNAMADSIGQDDGVNREEEGDTGTNQPKWGVALGKSCDMKVLRQLLTNGIAPEEGKKSWYLSRKLDGVRCIIRLTFKAEESLELTKIETLSRNENEFTSLDVLKRELYKVLDECPTIKTLLNTSLKMRRKSPSFNPEDGTRLYLDGEVCALVPEMESQDGFKEDFTEIVGAIRRQSYTVPNPAYFPFDILTEAEFERWGGNDVHHSLREPFHVRKKRVEDFVKYCQERGSVIVRKLDQLYIQNYAQVEAAIEQAAQHGWEGLILRKGDGYEGKRTSSIRKFKQWQDAEYTVKDVQTAIMRLPVDLKYEERRALASVTIDHNGTEVFVGSGFTVSERLRFAADPSLILGKEITVQCK